MKKHIFKDFKTTFVFEEKEDNYIAYLVIAHKVLTEWEMSIMRQWSSKYGKEGDYNPKHVKNQLKAVMKKELIDLQKGDKELFINDMAVLWDSNAEYWYLTDKDDNRIYGW